MGQSCTPGTGTVGPGGHFFGHESSEPGTHTAPSPRGAGNVEAAALSRGLHAASAPPSRRVQLSPSAVMPVTPGSFAEAGLSTADVEGLVLKFLLNRGQATGREVAGGELTMENLELIHNPATGTSEATLQLKANGGVLVIDDFGRQRISPAELLNRWIVPLEKRYDFLSLQTGLKIEVPFDQLIVFSTNLQPSSLVDEAFLRRIPYKIDIRDPAEAEFKLLLERIARAMGIRLEDGLADYLITRHYHKAGRELRFCHPRDLLEQIRTFCDFHELPLTATRKAAGAAVKNYFAIL